jgi:hypothetical protein
MREELKMPQLNRPRPRYLTATLILAVGVSRICFAQHQMEVGVGTHIGGQPLAPTLAAIDALDITARDDIRWNVVELTQGQLEYGSALKNVDALIADVTGRHKQPLIVIKGGAKFYDGGGQVTSAEGVAAYARYAHFVVDHLRGRVRQFEVWNEWDHGGGAAPGQTDKGDPVAYANLLRATYPAIKAANPDAVVIGGAIAVLNAAWIEKLARAGGLQFVDAFSLHPYVHCNAPSGPLPPSELRMSGRGGRLDAKSAAFEPIPTTVVGGSPEQAISLVDTLKKLLDQYAPGKSIPIYVTEIGWPTSHGQCGVEDSVAAAYLQRFMLLAAARPYVAGVWWYDIFDDGTDPTNREDRFGLLTHDYKPKAAHDALMAIKGVLASSTLPVESVGASGEIIIQGKQANGEPYYAAWLPTNNFTDIRPWSQGTELAGSGFHRSSVSSGPPTLSAVPTILVQK